MKGNLCPTYLFIQQKVTESFVPDRVEEVLGGERVRHEGVKDPGAVLWYI